LDDFTPRAYVTHDSGATWREIGHGLPAGQYLNVVRSDPRRDGLLYAGTSRGVYVSFDDGEHWQSLQLDLPTTGVNDLQVHEDDLVIATQGRAIWVLDAVAPLRQLALGLPGPQPLLVDPEPAVRLRFNQNKDTPLPPETPTGENPPAGAVLDYILPPGFNGQVSLEIVAADGQVVQHFDSEHPPPRAAARVYVADVWLGQPRPLAISPGHHRLVWDLRYPAPPTLRSQYSIAAVPERETPIIPQGAFVLPGHYTVRLQAADAVSTRDLEVLMDPRVVTSEVDLTKLLAFQRQVEARLQEVVDLARAMGVADVSEQEATGQAETPGGRVRRIAGALTDLAIDLEHADAAPTAPQRAVLVDQSQRLKAELKAWQESGNAPASPD